MSGTEEQGAVAAAIEDGRAYYTEEYVQKLKSEAEECKAIASKYRAEIKMRECESSASIAEEAKIERRARIALEVFGILMQGNKSYTAREAATESLATASILLGEESGVKIVTF